MLALLTLLPVMLSVGVINALVPILVIIVLIGAAAGLTRGFSFLDLFAVGTLMGMGSRSGTKASLAMRGYSSRLGSTTQALWRKQLTPKGASLLAWNKSKSRIIRESYYNTVNVANKPATIAVPQAGAATITKKKSKGWIKLATKGKYVFPGTLRAIGTGVAGASVRGHKQLSTAWKRAHGKALGTETGETPYHIKQLALQKELLSGQTADRRIAKAFSSRNQQARLSRNVQRLTVASNQIKTMVKERQKEMDTMKKAYGLMMPYEGMQRDMDLALGSIDKKYRKKFESIYKKNVFAGDRFRIFTGDTYKITRRYEHILLPEKEIVRNKGPFRKLFPKTYTKIRWHHPGDEGGNESYPTMPGR